jgi:hypothetical protein
VTKREAKRRVLLQAWRILDSATEVMDAMYPEGATEADVARINEAWDCLIQELFNRSGGR